MIIFGMAVCNVDIDYILAYDGWKRWRGGGEDMGNNCVNGKEELDDESIRTNKKWIFPTKYWRKNV